MVTTVAVVVGTHDLSLGVLAGVLLSGIFFAHKVGRVLRVDSASEDGGSTRAYRVVGQVFFASSEAFITGFDFKEVVPKVRIDVSRAHFWDITAVSALDKAVLKFRREGTEVEVIGMARPATLMLTTRSTLLSAAPRIGKLRWVKVPRLNALPSVTVSAGGAAPAKS